MGIRKVLVRWWRFWTRAAETEEMERLRVEVEAVQSRLLQQPPPPIRGGLYQGHASNRVLH